MLVLLGPFKKFHSLSHTAAELCVTVTQAAVVTVTRCSTVTITPEAFVIATSLCRNSHAHDRRYQAVDSHASLRSDRHARSLRRMNPPPPRTPPT